MSYKTCEKCDGDGEVWMQQHSQCPTPFPVGLSRVLCVECNGTGKIEIPKTQYCTCNGNTRSSTCCPRCGGPAVAKI